MALNRVRRGAVRGVRRDEVTGRAGSWSPNRWSVSQSLRKVEGGRLTPDLQSMEREAPRRASLHLAWEGRWGEWPGGDSGRSF